MTRVPEHPSSEAHDGAMAAPVAGEQSSRHGGVSRFSNKEWLVLLAAITVALVGTTAAALGPVRPAASAAAGTPAASPIDAKACPATPSVEATVIAALPTTATSIATTASTSATVTAATTTTNTVARASATRTTQKRKVAKKPASASTVATTAATPSLVSIGTAVNFGGYSGQPLRWRVLDVDNDAFVLLSEYVVSAGAFQSDWEGRDASRYSSSEVRAWLQDDFAAEAFDSTQSAALLPHSGGGAAGSDRVFLLSAAEVTRYLRKTADRKAAPRAGAAGVGFSGEALGLSGVYAAWWLSDPADDDFTAQVVGADGKLGRQLVYYADLGVRPAIRVNRDKVAFALDTQGGN